MTKERFIQLTSSRKTIPVREGCKYGVLDSIVNYSSKNKRELIFVDYDETLSEGMVTHWIAEEYPFLKDVSVVKIGILFKVKWGDVKDA